MVTLIEGLPGFESCLRYVLLSAPALAPLTCLQALDGERPSFLALDPRAVLPDYHVDLTPSDLHRLGAGPGETLLWLALVRLEGERVLVNLRAPVVVNPARMIGLQVMPADPPYSTHHRLFLG